MVCVCHVCFCWLEVKYQPDSTLTLMMYDLANEKYFEYTRKKLDLNKLHWPFNSWNSSLKINKEDLNVLNVYFILEQIVGTWGRCLRLKIFRNKSVTHAWLYFPVLQGDVTVQRYWQTMAGI